jgi:hypothetical protein
MIILGVTIGFGIAILNENYDFHLEKITIWYWIAVEVAIMLLVFVFVIIEIITRECECDIEMGEKIKLKTTINTKYGNITILDHIYAFIYVTMFIWGCVIYSQSYRVTIPYDLWLFFAIIYWIQVALVIISCFIVCCLCGALCVDVCGREKTRNNILENLDKIRQEENSEK